MNNKSYGGSHTPILNDKDFQMLFKSHFRKACSRLVILVLLLIPLGPPPLAERAPLRPSLLSAARSAPLIASAPVARDEAGRPYWEVKYAPETNWCVPVPLSWPLDLDNVDFRDFTNFTLTLTLKTHTYMKQQRIDAELTPDPFWTVAVNIAGMGNDPFHPPRGQRVAGTFNAENFLGDVPQAVTFNRVDPRWLQDGLNKITLYHNEPDFDMAGCTRCGSYCVWIESLRLTGDDFRIMEVSPKSKAKSVDNEKPGIEITFSKNVDPDSVNDQNFLIWTLDTDTNKVLVEGRFEEGDTDYSIRFIPSKDLLPGVYYQAQVLGTREIPASSTISPIKSKDGRSNLVVGRKWSFSTIPDLKVQVDPIQVISGAPLVAGKSLGLKTFVDWTPAEGIHKNWRVPHILLDDVQVQWTCGGDSVTAGWRNGGSWSPSDKNRLRRPLSTYDKAAKAGLRDSITYFHGPLLGTSSCQFTSDVIVKTDKGNPKVYSSEKVSRTIQDSAAYHPHFRGLIVSKWYNIPLSRPATLNAGQVIGQFRSKMKAIFPVIGVPVYQNPSAIPFIPAGRCRSSVWSCDWSDGQTSAPSRTVRQSLLENLSELCDQTTNCDAMVGLVPLNWWSDNTKAETLSENGIGWDIARKGILVDIETPKTDTRSYFVLSHEVGHIINDSWDWGDENPPVATGSEGLYVDKRLDRRDSVWNNPPAPNTILANFMAFNAREGLPEAGETGLTQTLWIGKHFYDNLLTLMRRSSLLRQDLMPSSLPLMAASGYINAAITPNQVLFKPFYMLDPGEFALPPSGPYTFRFLDYGNNVLAQYPFKPDPSLQTGGEVYFSLKVPYPAATAKVQILHNGVVIGQNSLSAEAPQLTVLSPTAGQTLSGTATISWTGSDADSDPLHYALYLSLDNRQTWTALLSHSQDSGFLWETSGFPSSSTVFLRVSATDGMRTTSQVVGPLTISNPPQVAAMDPAHQTENVPISSPIELYFSDRMDPADLNAAHVHLRDITHGVNIETQFRYQDTEQQLQIMPDRPLNYATDYELTVLAGIRNDLGVTLASPFTARFRTETDPNGPWPAVLNPEAMALEVPLQTEILIVWDKELNASTVHGGSVLVKTQNGLAVNGTVSHDAGSRTTRFRPAVPLSASTYYVVTLKTSIQDSLGLALIQDFEWQFQTGADTWPRAHFTDSFQDEAVDDDADGFWDRLRLRVGVYVPAAGTWVLRGALGNSEGQILTQSSVQSVLAPGTHFLTLDFSANAIKNSGFNGPFQLLDLVFSKVDDFNTLITYAPHYFTGEYRFNQFDGAFSFKGLPDVRLQKDQKRPQAFNVRHYAQHPTKTGNQLNYQISALADVQAGITLDQDGFININPEPGWIGVVQATVEASDGALTARDTFEVNVGWNRLYLPLLQGGGQTTPPQTTRSEWLVLFADDFENNDFWQWATGSIIHNTSEFIHVFWGRRDCLAFSGTHSAWILAGGEDGALFPCGGYLDKNYETRMTLRHSFSMRYLGAAQIRLKAYTEMGPHDGLCLEARFNQGQITSAQCINGNTGGWQDLILDLENLPGVGNVLGQDLKMELAVYFQADLASSRTPPAVFVDDVEFRVCPAGLTQYCPK